MISFDEKQKFIVTGASSGIGEGVALLLNELGATVIGIGRSQERLEAVRNKCKYPENMFLENKDLTDDIEGLPAYVKSLKEKYGKFQGMAYCAGTLQIMPLRSVDFSAIKEIFDINYFAPIMMAKGLLDKRNNVGEGTSLVFIASLGAETCDRGMVSYAGTKGALIKSAKVLAREAALNKMRVNCVSPGMIKTPMTEKDENMEVKELLYPLGIGEISDVANLTVFLLSEKAKWITAQNYILDGCY